MVLQLFACELSVSWLTSFAQEFQYLLAVQQGLRVCSGCAGQARCKLTATLSGHHDRAIFSVDWSLQGVIATGTLRSCLPVSSFFSISVQSHDGHGTFVTLLHCCVSPVVPWAMECHRLHELKRQMGCWREDVHKTAFKYDGWHP